MSLSDEAHRTDAGRSHVAEITLLLNPQEASTLGSFFISRLEVDFRLSVEGMDGHASVPLLARTAAGATLVWLLSSVPLSAISVGPQRKVRGLSLV